MKNLLTLYPPVTYIHAVFIIVLFAVTDIHALIIYLQFVVTDNSAVNKHMRNRSDGIFRQKYHC